MRTFNPTTKPTTQDSSAEMSLAIKIQFYHATPTYLGRGLTNNAVQSEWRLVPRTSVADFERDFQFIASKYDGYSPGYRPRCEITVTGTLHDTSISETFTDLESCESFLIENNAINSNRLEM